MDIIKEAAEFFEKRDHNRREREKGPDGNKHGYLFLHRKCEEK